MTNDNIPNVRSLFPTWRWFGRTLLIYLALALIGGICFLAVAGVYSLLW